MEMYFRKKVDLLFSNSGLEREDLRFLSEFTENASSIQLGKMYVSALRSDDRKDYFLALVYGVKLKRYLDIVEYLTDADRQSMLGLVASISGKDAKRLYGSVQHGTLRGENIDTLAEEIRGETGRILDITRKAFTERIRRCSDEKDQTAIRKIREKLGSEE